MGAADCCRDSEVGIVRQFGCWGGAWQCPGSFLPGGPGRPAMERAAVKNEYLMSLASVSVALSFSPPPVTRHSCEQNEGQV